MSFSLLMKVEGSGGANPADQQHGEVPHVPKWSVHMILLQQCLKFMFSSC